MRTHRLLALALTALAGCAATVDTSHDAAALHDTLRTRAGGDLPRPDASASPAIGDDALALLRAPLDDDAAVKVALLENRRVRAIYERLGIARSDLVQAGLLRNPVFDADARFLFDGGTELELGLAQPFLDLFYRPLRTRVAEHELAAAQALLADELVHVVFAVRRAMASARAASQIADVARTALQAAAASHELAAALHAAGNVTDRALASERAGETRARLDLATAELAASDAREPLQRLLGLWGAHTEWRLAGELAADPLQGVDLAHVESRAIASSLALAVHRAQLDALAQRIGLRSWQRWLPDGALGVSAIRESDGDWGLGPRVALELPLFDDGGAKRARDEHLLRAGLHEQTQLAVEIRSAARVLRERASQLAARARFLHDVHLPQREQVVSTTLQHYNAMQIGVFDVLVQRRQQLADQREYVLTLRDAHLARLDLQELLAGRVPASAFQPLASGAGADDETTTTTGGHR